jgi:hypothetical protein
MIHPERSFSMLWSIAIREVERKVRVLAVGVCFEGVYMVQSG